MAVLMISIKSTIRPEFFSDALSVLEEYGVQLLSMIAQRIRKEEVYQTTLFVTKPDSPQDIFKVKDMLSRLPHVNRVEVIEFPLEPEEAKIIGITLQDVYYMFGKILEIGAAGEALLYHIGYNMGSNIAKKVMSTIADRGRAIEYVKMYFEGLGLGLFESPRLITGREILVRIYENSECQAFKYELSSRPLLRERYRSNLVRGFLAGYFSQVYGGEVSVFEEKCIVRGAPYCQFRVRVRAPRRMHPRLHVDTSGLTVHV